MKTAKSKSIIQLSIRMKYTTISHWMKWQLRVWVTLLTLWLPSSQIMNKGMTDCKMHAYRYQPLAYRSGFA